eukprot:GHVU01197889.1.p1 GENE.GHVU01197889.1~~GHVU01197889.1.p1  ORF type:complete len:300 (-),score=14.37 GHVU01197889.1:49-831(-)
MGASALHRFVAGKIEAQRNWQNTHKSALIVAERAIPECLAWQQVVNAVTLRHPALSPRTSLGALRDGGSGLTRFQVLSLGCASARRNNGTRGRRLPRFRSGLQLMAAPRYLEHTCRGFGCNSFDYFKYRIIHASVWHIIECTDGLCFPDQNATSPDTGKRRHGMFKNLSIFPAVALMAQPLSAQAVTPGHDMAAQLAGADPAAFNFSKTVQIAGEEGRARQADRGAYIAGQKQVVQAPNPGHEMQARLLGSRAKASVPAN